jgi:cellulose biosynthesis protein BcsQ
MRTLLLDADSQGSVNATLGLKPELHLYDFLVTQMSVKNCIVNACEELDVICSDRKTQQAEDLITNPFAKSGLS